MPSTAPDPVTSKLATVPLVRSGGKQRFWMASGRAKRFEWLPTAESTLDAVVHFVQSGSGTGVHVGGGRALRHVPP